MKSLALAALVVFSLMAPGGQAQTGTIRGVVFDPTGAVMPGVAVNATRVATGDITRAITNESGAYTFANLPTGTYEVAAGLPGFAIRRSGPVVVGPSSSVQQNFALSVESQQLPMLPMPRIPPPSPFNPAPVPEIIADSQSTQGAVTSYRGRVRMTIERTIIRADEVDFNSLTQSADVRGNVSVQLRQTGGVRVIPLSN
jgi:hypothetical protein